MSLNNMLFDIVELYNNDENKPVKTRHAVRGIAIKESKILMVMADRGDCKLPGGGIKTGEVTQTPSSVKCARKQAGYALLSAL